MKKLVIKVEVMLPDDDFAAAKLLSKLGEPIAAFRRQIENEGGKTEHQIITARGPHKKPAPSLHPMAVVRSGDDAA